jgi:putative salt-induced outer membrane protein YdiY
MDTLCVSTILVSFLNGEFMRNVLAAIALLAAAQMAIADTVSLKNGDKITGTIQSVTATSVVVQTPYAGTMTIDKATVKTMQSDKAVAVTLASGQTQQLFLSPTPDGSGWQTSAAFVPPPPPTPPRFTSYLEIGPDWKNQLSLGASQTSGNDNTTTFAGDLTFHYLHKPDELILKFAGAYGMTNETGKANDRQSAGFFAQTAIYRHDLTDRLFWYVSDDVRYDAIKGISIQATGIVGLGYKVIDEDKFKVDVRGGPGVTYTKTFDGNSDFSAAAEAGLRIQWLLSERATFTHEDVYTTSLQDFNIWRIHSETALNFKLDLELGLGLKFAFSDDYENEPSAGRKNNDTRLMASLTLDF